MKQIIRQAGYRRRGAIRVQDAQGPLFQPEARPHFVADACIQPSFGMAQRNDFLESIRNVIRVPCQAQIARHYFTRAHQLLEMRPRARVLDLVEPRRLPRRLLASTGNFEV